MHLSHLSHNRKFRDCLLKRSYTIRQYSNSKHKSACVLCVYVTVAKMISFTRCYGEFDAVEFEVRTTMIEIMVTKPL